MQAAELEYLRCPVCRGVLAASAAALPCDGCGASYPVEDGIPRLLRPGSAAELAAQIAALDADMRRHDWVVAKMSLATLRWIPAERNRLLGEIGIEPGWAVLDHCTGPGSNLPALAKAVGAGGRLTAMDLSPFVLGRAAELARRRRIEVALHQADALALPYAERSFDAVVHYGALNQFAPNIAAAIAEIVRVTRPGGLVVLLDEGIEERRRAGRWGRLLMRANPLFASLPPLDLLPAGVEPRVRWVIRGMFYEVRFRTPC